jgi:arabinogalactan oligomer/maltooligosaccharide transport system permease protein
MKTNVNSQSSTLKKNKLGQKAINTIANTSIYIILSIMSVLWVLPIVYLLYTSFRVTPDTGIINTLFPDDLKLGFGNFIRLFRDTMFAKWLGNTLLVAIVSCIMTTLFVLMVSYALSRLRFKLRKPIMNVLLVLGMFPGFMSMIAIYFILKAMGLTNSLFALILVYSGGAALNYYICKGFFDTIPKSLEEAAILDGASQLRVFFAITVPMSKPIIIYTVLTSFISPWCDFIFVNTIINDREKYTVALGLYKMINAEKSSFNENFTVFCAGACTVGAIITALFMSMQRYYIEGVTSGAVKG